MKRVLWTSCLAVWLSGCASSLAVRQPDPLEQQVRDQAELLEVQRQQLWYLQQDRVHLSREMANLRRELAEVKQPVHEALVETSEPVAPESERVAPAQPPQIDDSGKVILGRFEWVWFDLFTRSVPTRLDTGVRGSMIYIAHSQFFERDGEQWVRFALAESAREATGRQVVYESPLLRRLRARVPNSDESEVRPVVRLKMRVGNLVDDTEFTLVRRENPDAAVVLGSAFLRDIAVVDVSREFTQVKHLENSPL